MRTTLDIDDDILSAARDLARAEKKTVGKLISDLARKALTAPELANLDERDQPKLSRWPTFPRRGGIVTTELVERIQEEIDMEDAMPQLLGRDEVRPKATSTSSKRSSGRGRSRRKKTSR
jgi:hypothetical protein